MSLFVIFLASKTKHGTLVTTIFILKELLQFSGESMTTLSTFSNFAGHDKLNNGNKLFGAFNKLKTEL